MTCQVFYTRWGTVMDRDYGDVLDYEEGGVLNIRSRKWVADLPARYF